MTAPRCDISIDLVREWLSYSPETGELTWRKNTGGRHGRAGTRAGYLRKDGYWEVMLKGHSLLVHRVAWVLMTGSWPSLDIDHFDGNRANNRFANLREATRSQNCANAVRSGFFRHGERFGAKISPNGQQIHLGIFDTEEEARATYLEATRRYFGEFSVTERHVAASLLPEIKWGMA